ncbi:monovalent cation:proton antiporter-2 (CPA2) family protein [Parvularcula maris]|uniref:Monovalent cation:proton antiporter-2 (CPA2) family protein n=1 Tax=Parvularcula maris TaxID=2965077 RepID=A0A9X2L915_9PROT|nr:monovalent cation:proton antiporter-2 (CPA2) family protein [Parvularcula maris]MCQ8185345.1 monovalent cation:proton antiporter-2 (CPA2) family protein [Parvularcula maris]
MAAAGGSEFLVDAAIYLGATTVAVPIFKKLKLGTILGFLAAGVLFGPHALGLLSSGDGVSQIAELGVVLFLFVIGLELSAPRLWSLKRTIFGLGLLQMLVTGTCIGFAFETFGWLPRGPAFIAGFALACSSTAFALSLLEERGELNTPFGTKAFSVLLFQDIAVIPLLAAIPFVARGQSGEEGASMDPLVIVQAIGALILLILVGRFLLNRYFRLVAVSGSREAFTAAALFVVAATALLLAEAGLSMALGAFLAGVLLAESSFKHQIEADIEPFRELLLGLFFIGVGMQLDLGVMLANWWIVLLGAAALIIFKGGVLYLLVRMFGSKHTEALKVGGVLSQGGEFGFVVFSLGVGRGIFDNEFATISSSVITLSMVATPLIMMALSRVRTKTSVPTPDAPEDEEGEVLVVGYGRVGQIVTQILRGSKVSVTAIDNDPVRIETARAFGAKVFYGDGTDMHLLVGAGATRANAVVFAIDDAKVVAPAVAALRERCPKVKIIVSAYDRLHEMELMDEEIDIIIRETFESAVLMAKRTLGFLGLSDGMIGEIEAEFRDRDRDRLMAQKAGDHHSGQERLDEPFHARTKHKKAEKHERREELVPEDA